MIHKKLLRPERVRTIQGSFSAIEHRFLRDGFWTDLNHDELLLYLLLVLVADRHGLSYYSYDKLCELLGITAVGARIVPTPGAWFRSRCLD